MYVYSEYSSVDKEDFKMKFDDYIDNGSSFDDVCKYICITARLVTFHSHFIRYPEDVKEDLMSHAVTYFIGKIKNMKENGKKVNSPFSYFYSGIGKQFYRYLQKHINQQAFVKGVLTLDLTDEELEQNKDVANLTSTQGYQAFVKYLQEEKGVINVLPSAKNKRAKTGEKLSDVTIQDIRDILNFLGENWRVEINRKRRVIGIINAFNENGEALVAHKWPKVRAHLYKLNNQRKES